MSRILHVFSTFDPGGPQVRSLDLIAAMPDDEHVVVPMDARAGAAERFPAGVRARVLMPPPGRKKLLYGLTMRRLLRELRPDLMVTSNWGAIDALIGSRLAGRIPVVHAEDGFGPDEIAVRKRRRRLARFVVLNAIHATVVPSTTLLRIARAEYGVAAARVRYIPNGVDVARFRPRRDPAWRRAHGVPDCALLVGSLGGLRAEKDLGVLLRAFAGGAPADAWLAIVGGGPDRDALEALARELGIAGRVVFGGPAVDTPTCYASFDLFAMSSKTEQMPIALLEAMSCGLAAVVTDVGDCGRLVGGESAVIAPPRDPVTLAAALRRLTADASMRATLGAANRARVERDYAKDVMVRRWLALFREAMDPAASLRSSPTSEALA